MPPLRLAVDARVVANDTRGIGRYARAVLRRLIVRDDVELTLLAYGPFPSRHRRALARALGSGRFSIASRAGRRLDLIWHPANGTFFSCAQPSVATIHDAVPFRYPDPDPRRRERAQAPFLRSARDATRVIAVSAFGREELQAILHVSPARIEVIAHGVEPSFTPGPTQSLPGGLVAQRYFLFVGDPVGEPRKNFALLYDAYRRAWPAGEGPVLVVAGPQAPALPGVVHVGELTDDLNAPANDRLRALYRGAIALVLPSYHETFGMPMLEAMACGTPAIASRASCLPEIGGDAALYAPPDAAAAWAAMLTRVAADERLRERHRRLGLERSALFSWDESAARHLALFTAVASR